MQLLRFLGRFSGVTSIAFLSFCAGTLYIIDCRRAGGAIDQCWLTGLPIAGLGGTAAGGFASGYGTFNPALSRPEPATPKPATPKPATEATTRRRR
jgi:hypothetical protein